MGKQETAIKYLRSKEWSAGNGQCPDCCGAPESWHGHPCFFDAKKIGHEKKCALADALVSLGGKVLRKGDFKSVKKYEWVENEQGIMYTREVANG